MPEWSDRAEPLEHQSWIKFGLGHLQSCPGKCLVSHYRVTFQPEKCNMATTKIHPSHTDYGGAKIRSPPNKEDENL